MLRRKIYDSILEWKKAKNGTCLLIKGARQVGKTYIIRKFGEDNYKNTIYINFDIDEDLKSAFDGNLNVDHITMLLSGLRTGFKFEEGSTLLILDEIQNCPRARTALKAFAVDGRYDVIASGSLLGVNLKKVPSFPVGYETDMTLRPLDFEEFVWGMGLDEKVIEEVKSCISEKTPLSAPLMKAMTDLFDQYMIIGGMPKAVTTFIEKKDFNLAADVVKNILSVTKSDIATYSSASDRVKTRACLDSIPAQLTKTNKKFVYANVMEGNNPSTRKYAGNLLWLYEAGLIEYCYNLKQPTFPLESNMFIDSFKVYMSDTGMLMNMYPVEARRSILLKHPSVNKGGVTENVVADAIAASGRRLYYMHNGRREIDFIVQLGEEIAAMEVKSGKDRTSRTLDNMAKEKGPITRFIKLEDGDIRVDENGVEHYPLFATGFIDSMCKKE